MKAPQKLKVHRPIVQEVAATLFEIFNQQQHADKVIERAMRQNRKWGARDRRQFAEMAYDLVRWWRLILVVNLGVDLGNEVSIEICQKAVESYLEGFDVEKLQRMAKTAAVRESLPDDLYELLKSELGDQTDRCLARLNLKAPQFLRVNELKTDRPSLIRRLAEEGVVAEPVSTVSTALRLVERKNVFITESFKKGLFEMQDAGSQQIAPLVLAKPGERVIDACAGAGGKTLHLAAMMKNQGRIVAMDISAPKLSELSLRARRAGATSIETRWIESTKIIKRLHESADHVLLDAPCSGLGVLRRYPDTKFKFQQRDLNRLAETQLDILARYALMAKVGGTVCYATCSILPSENSLRIREYLSATEGASGAMGRFEIEEEMQISPIETDFDGFYAVRLRRKS